MTTPQGIDPRVLDWLLAAQAVVLAPHALHLSPWIPLLWLAIAALVRSAARRGRPLPGRWLRMGLLVGAIGGVLFSYQGIAGRDGGVALLSAMMALKLLELNGRRDAVLLLFLGYFLVVTNFLFTQSIPIALYMFVAVVALTAALGAVAYPPGAGRVGERLRLAGALLAQALPMAVVFFLLFPRVPGPLWHLPEESRGARAGLSDTMSPGDIGRLGQNAAVAFRVEFEGPIPDLRQAYWRGPVLWRFDGRTWHMVTRPPGGERHFDGIGEAQRYSVTLEPHNRRWLFALEMAATLPPGATMNPDYQMLDREPVTERKRYRLLSYPRYRIGVNDPPNWRALGLGGVNNQRARDLADQWRVEEDGAQAVVQRALRYFRREPFVYTLTPPRLGANPVDEFLFDTRRGFCEHYAGAFVFLMRAAGVPARVVTGYQGGEINGDYVIVRQSDAHAWAEVWLKGPGWVRIDPTAAVAPERIERGLDAALPAGEPVPFMSRRSASWLRAVSLRWDRLNTYWHRWVLGYGEDVQLDLLRRLAPLLASWERMALGLVGFATLLLGLVALYLFRPGAGPALDPVQRVWLRFCRKLARRGLPRAPTEGPLDYQRRIIRQRPAIAAKTGEINRLYAALRYHHAPDAGELKRLQRLVRRFRVP
ncbi:transglutaminase TgpA family protein [Endothiovibrio diazotrophicus]